MAVDLALLLEPLGAEETCGENLEYDPAFLELEKAAERKPEQQFGDTIIPAEEPDWADVQSRALEVLARTKDLRALYLLTQALIRTEGLPGFETAMAAVRGYIEQYWEGFYPRLDPDDDNDPTPRVNLIAALAAVGAILNPLRTTPVVRSALGRFSLREIAWATGTEDPPAGAEVPTAATIDGAFMAADVAEMDATSAAAEHAVEHIRAFDAGLTDKVGGANNADLSALIGLLRDAHKVLSAQIERRRAAEAPAEPGTDADAETPGTVTAAEGGSAPARRAGINSRADVARAIDEICAYFERHEPSSPVPILLQRAKGLVDKDFMAVLQDLVPEAVSAAEKFRTPGS